MISTPSNAESFHITLLIWRTCFNQSHTQSRQSGLYTPRRGSYTNMSKKGGQRRQQPAQKKLLSTCDDTLCCRHTAAAAATAQATGSTPLKAHSVLGQEACHTAAAATLHTGSIRGRTHTLRTTALHCTQRRRAASYDATSCKKNQPASRPAVRCQPYFTCDVDATT
jgi:hypothetical protein